MNPGQNLEQVAELRGALDVKARTIHQGAEKEIRGIRKRTDKEIRDVRKRADRRLEKIKDKRNCLTPIASLPVEVLVLIFLEIRDCYRDLEDAINVCTTWRSLTLSSGSL